MATLDQLWGEVELLDNALEQSGKEYDEEYAKKIARSQLQEIGEMVEAMSKMVGDGEAISITELPEEEE